VTAALTPLKTELASLKTENDKLKKELVHVEEDLCTVKRDIDNQLQESKRANIVISSRWPDNDSSPVSGQVKAFARDVLLLSVDTLGISECFRMGNNQTSVNHGGLDSSPSGVRGGTIFKPIMVTFNSVRCKQSFMDARRKVKTGKLTSPVYLNDDLTLQR